MKKVQIYSGSDQHLWTLDGPTTATAERVATDLNRFFANNNIRVPVTRDGKTVYQNLVARIRQDDEKITIERRHGADLVFDVLDPDSVNKILNYFAVRLMPKYAVLCVSVRRSIWTDVQAPDAEAAIEVAMDLRADDTSEIQIHTYAAENVKDLEPQQPTYALMFEDPGMVTMVFGGPDGQEKAQLAYDRFPNIPRMLMLRIR